MKKFEKWQYALLLLLLMGIATACSDDENLNAENEVELTEQDLAEMAAADKFAAANSVIRALAMIDELPDNWESTIFEPKAGIAVDEANPDVRNMMALDADDAQSYFLSIVPDEGLNGNTWQHEGVGSLTFRTMSEAKCYAVMDVNLVQMPGLKQIRFVNKEALGENKFWGTPYYHVGDLVEDRDGHYWICVRPAGGPKGKDNAFFVSLDKDLVEYKTVTQKIYGVDENGKLDKKKLISSENWTYATNLVQERVAIWAGHTFAMLYGCYTEYKEFYKHYQDKHDALNDISFDVAELNACFDLNAFNLDNAFLIAYGSYISNKHSKVRQEKLIQPYLMLAHVYGKDGTLQEKISKVWVDETLNPKNQPYLYSLTTDYDPLSMEYITGTPWGNGCGHEGAFDINNYMMAYGESFGIQDYNGVGHPVMNGVLDTRVLVMTQLTIKDNGEPNEDLTVVNSLVMDEPNYWKILESKNFKRCITDEKYYEKVVTNLYE